MPGLTSVEAAGRLARDGPNALASAARKSTLAIALQVVRAPMFLTRPAPSPKSA